MKVLLLPAGSHGDVHPFVGVGIALKQRGHDVTLATCGLFAELADRCELNFHEIGSAEQFLELSQNPDIWHPHKAAALIAREVILPGMRVQYQAIEQLTSGSGEETVLVGSALGFGIRLSSLAANDVLERLQNTTFGTLWACG